VGKLGGHSGKGTLGRALWGWRSGEAKIVGRAQWEGHSGEGIVARA